MQQYWEEYDREEKEPGWGEVGAWLIAIAIATALDFFLDHPYKAATATLWLVLLVVAYFFVSTAWVVFFLATSLVLVVLARMFWRRWRDTFLHLKDLVLDDLDIIHR